MPGLIKVNKSRPSRHDWAMNSPEPRSTAQSRILSTITAFTPSNQDSDPTIFRKSLLSTTFKEIVPHCATNYNHAYTHSYLKDAAKVVYDQLDIPDNNDLDPIPTKDFYVSAIQRHLARAVMDCREVELEAWPTIMREELEACLEVIGELDEDRMLRRCDRARGGNDTATTALIAVQGKDEVVGVVEHGAKWVMEHVDVAAVCYLIGLLHGAGILFSLLLLLGLLREV